MAIRRRYFVALAILAALVALLSGCQPGVGIGGLVAATPSATRPASAPAVAPTSPVGTAPSPKPGLSDFSFAVLGDNRNGDETYASLLDMVSRDRVDFLVNTGDLVPNGMLDQFKDFRKLMARFGKPFYSVPGNHDVANDGTLSNYLQYSGAPAVHYAFDRGQVHFAMVNSALGDLNAAELGWLEADLAGTQLPVSIIVLHHPPFDPVGGSHILGKGASELMALATRYKVRYVIAGHIHEYAREVRDGVIYLVTGGAGAPLYPPPDKGGFYHYVRITVRGAETSDEVVRLP